MIRQAVLERFAREGFAEELEFFALFRQRSDMLAHDAVQRRLPGESRRLMQRRNVAEADDGFGDRRNTVDYTLESVPAA